MPKPVKKYETYLETWEDESYQRSYGELKDFIVFAFHQYYPQGGLEDIATSCDSFAEAREFIEASFVIDKRDGSKHWSYDYFQVVRKSDWTVVLEASVKHIEISTA